MGDTAKHLAGRQILYLNSGKLRDLYAQLSGAVPSAQASNTDLGGGVSVGVPGGKVSTGGRRVVSVTSEINDAALAIKLIKLLERKRMLVPDKSHTKFLNSIDQSIATGRSFLSCISGPFGVPPNCPIAEWLRAAGHPGYVNLFLDPHDYRVPPIMRRGFASGLWVGMNTDHILDRHKYHLESTSHLAVRLRGGRGWVSLSVIGWVEGNGYINPLVIYW